MLKAGLVSVSFRKNTVEEIIEEASASQLSVIEWGSDIHCPVGDIDRARTIAGLCRARGIELLTYGTYFDLGKNTPDDFCDVISSAEALGAKKIRIWGQKYIPECQGELWEKAVSDTVRICNMASVRGMLVCLECHDGTVTEDYHSALEFIKQVNHPALRLYWQINEKKDKAYNLCAARALAPYLECIHAFYTIPNRIRIPIINGKADWLDYLDALQTGNKKELPILLEFMPDGRIESLKSEAEGLHSIIKSYIEAL